MKKWTKIGEGQLCRDCLVSTERFKRSVITEKQRKAQFYFTLYDWCNSVHGGCGKYFFIDSSKVYNEKASDLFY